MKTRSKGVVFMCVVAGSFVPALAQITIDATVVNQKLALGRTVNNNVDTLVTSVDIGQKGVTSWDFSGLQTHTVTGGLSVDPATSPFIAQFPGATFALKSTLAGNFPGAPGPVQGDLYLYFVLATDLLNPGSAGSGQVNVGSWLPATLQITNAPSDIYYHLPSTMGDSWRSTYASTTAYTVTTPFGPIGSSSTKNYDVTYEVDAWGTMKLPGESKVDALRIKFQDFGTGANLGYIFLSNSGGLVRLLVNGPSLPDTGIVPVAKSITWNASTFPTEVRTASGVPQEFTVRQNYPNPFNPATEIGYELASETHVTLTVFDILGRHVATLVDEVKPAGAYSFRFDASHLASGVYLYRLSAGNFVQTRRMMLLK